ncbi:hypothetical protein BD410DRAFT_795544 [Rickenella mellea]|uniref:F-box domain-containing protein n=1 Tax=Rickenella mellea TaxID=50990 RepID=A0A4Y7PMI6_9AGAM|nr:hypothetical protein BD410DRAFT_795544 [Rickenella mellea]
MGTRGYFAYRHRGKYYTRYHRCDSYPEGLGYELVTAIPVNKRDFEEWLKNKREFFDAEELRVSKLKFDPDSEERVYGYCEEVSESEPSDLDCIDWVYYIDLDHKSFTIHWLVTFPLDNIPRGEDDGAWMQYVDFDKDVFYNRILKLSTPREYAVIHSIDPPEPSASGLDQYSKLKQKALDPSEWTSQSLNLSQEFSLHAAEGLIVLHRHSFSTVALHQPESLIFQTLALGLLSMAAEGLIWISPKQYDDSESKSDKLLATFTSWMVTKVAERRGSACFYWFRDVLIWFASHLDHEGNRKAAVGLAMAMIQELNLDYCIALVFSVRHLVVVKVSNGVVYESEVIEVLAAIPDVNWQEKLIDGLRPLVHFLRLREYAVEGAKSNLVSGNTTPFPVDILLGVLQYADNDTYDQFRKLSRLWREICKRHLRVGPYTLVRRDGDTFCARGQRGPEVPLKLFWKYHKSCTPYGEAMTENFEVFIQPQVDTCNWPISRGFAGRNFVPMKLHEGQGYDHDVRSTNFRLVIAEEGSDLDKAMERVRYGEERD